MSAFFGKILAYLLPSLLNWVKTFAAGLIAKFIKLKTLKKSQSARSELADKVEAIRQQILAMEKKGLPVPEELKEELRIEASKLIRS